MDPEPPSLYHLEYLLAALSFDFSIVFGILLLIFLLFCSAMISGSEVAFFSLSPNDLHDLNKDNDKGSDQLIALKEQPRKLLATILIVNNIINIAIVILSTFLLNKIIPESSLVSSAEFLSEFIPFDITTLTSMMSFLITVVGVTFLLVLFGEVAPKIYASINNKKFALMMTRPMGIMNIVFSPLSRLMVNWSTSIEKRFESTGSTSRQDIDKAIDLTVSKEVNAESEVGILKGLIKFGELHAKQIMRPRGDVVALDFEEDYSHVISVIKESGYSRIPVYQEDFDNIVGLLYIKDLIGQFDNTADFEWQTVIRPNVMYVPESKKIDELLREFQVKKLHMAIIVDEFGGSSGLVTLEDIMEEVIGEITDEFDEDEEVEYKKIDNFNYIFEGKTMLNDVCRIVGEDTEVFDSARGESDSLAGLVLENVGYIPKKDKEFVLERFKLKVLSVSKRRIEKIKFTILEKSE